MQELSENILVIPANGGRGPPYNGFLRVKIQARKERLTLLEQSPHTVVIYEAPHRIEALFTLCQTLFAPTRRFLIARELTKRFESIILSDLQTLTTQIQEGHIPTKGEFIIAIEGKPAPVVATEASTQAMERVLRVLMEALPPKQAIQIATQLTPFHKNALYDCAMRIKQEKG